MTSKNLSMIVAMADNNAIGNNNGLLFHLSGDLKRFKAITTGHPIIMGKKTLLSLPKWPLPNRRNIVLTHNRDNKFMGCEIVTSVKEALELIKGESEAFIIGGGSVYREFYPYVNKLYLTRVYKSFESDTFFPEIDFDEWKELQREDLHDDKNDFDYAYLNLERKK
ncbi:MAG: dihydrofolate reductase [Prolixibacteraceae bacterium]|nr:dihydrofolate reductase [Prolixibacteraceae bacterium]